PILLCTGAQLRYVRSIAAPLTALELASAADAARDRASALRAQVAAQIESGVDAELALLDPLFERFDPAEVAAAILAMQRAPKTPLAPAAEEKTRVFLNVGKKDKAAAKDVVGALIREAGLGKTDIGRVDVRETFTIVEL